MIITFPHMGTVEIMMRDLINRLGAEHITPPPTTNKTLRLGTKYSPEFACLPLKVTVGNLIEGLEAGADTIVMAGGCGPCRFGYYAEIQKRILDELGYDFQFITVEPPGVSIIQFYQSFKKVAGKNISPRKLWKILKISFRKAKFIDRIDQWSIKMRAFETNRGEVSLYRKHVLEMMDNAFTEEEIIIAEQEICQMLHHVKMDLTKTTLQVGMIGEFYMLLEPFINYDIEEFLGYRGVSIEKSVYLTDWLGPGRKNPLSGVNNLLMIDAASPYLNFKVGGEGQVTIGHIVKMAEEGFDGAVHLMPFTCMPETIAKSIMPKVQEDHDLPILSIVIDEQTGKAGLLTRLEAFIDLMHSKRRASDYYPKIHLMDKGGIPLAGFSRS